MSEVISVAQVDATATLEALLGPLKFDGLLGYDFADVALHHRQSAQSTSYLKILSV